MKQITLAALLCASALATPAHAQGMDHHQHHPAPAPAPSAPQSPASPGHEHTTESSPATASPPHAAHSGHDASASMPMPWQTATGTSRLPGAQGMMHGAMVEANGWTAMLHGTVSGQYTAASGPRGADKAYATSMLTGSVEKGTGWGRVGARAMLSLEPAMRAEGYPNLFATGETAGGKPLFDRQHPHDLFMELAGRVDVNIGANSTVFVYGGPVGEPALGPSAFVHRGSSHYNPEPPISHHWFDSTHITYGVVTGGISTPLFQLEGSAFRGREPDERRWNIESGTLDSWSMRGTLTPTPNWAIQASYGEMAQPEALHVGEDERRFTASVHYDNGAGFAAMAAYSAKKRVPGITLPAWLAEANWDLDTANTVFGRFEHVRNDELFPDHDDPRHDQPFSVAKLQAGYARRMPVGPFELAVGASLATFFKPKALDTAYGTSPVQATVFARLALVR